MALARSPDDVENLRNELRGLPIAAVQPGIPEIHQMHHAARSLRRLHGRFARVRNPPTVRCSARVLCEFDDVTISALSWSTSPCLTRPFLMHAMPPGIPEIHQKHRAIRSHRRLRSGLRFSTRLALRVAAAAAAAAAAGAGLGRAGAKISNERKQAKCCCCCAAAAEAPEMGALLPLKCTGTTVVRPR